MTILPKTPIDVALAPVVAAIDLNLQRLRDRPASEIEYELQLELNRPLFTNTSDERAIQVLNVALRDVDLHGWNAIITDDASRLHVGGGSVSLDLGLGANVMHYIESGVVSVNRS